MTVFLFDNAPEGLRGEVTRWFLEVKPGVFVGKVSRRVSDLLWERFCSEGAVRGGLRIETARNEQGYRIDMLGTPRRRIVDFEGVQLICRSTEEGEIAPEMVAVDREDPYIESGGPLD